MRYACGEGCERAGDDAIGVRSEHVAGNARLCRVSESVRRAFDARAARGYRVAGLRTRIGIGRARVQQEACAGFGVRTV